MCQLVLLLFETWRFSVGLLLNSLVFMDKGHDCSQDSFGDLEVTLDVLGVSWSGLGAFGDGLGPRHGTKGLGGLPARSSRFNLGLGRQAEVIRSGTAHVGPWHRGSDYRRWQV